MDWLHLPAVEANPIGPFIFVLFFSFLKCFPFSAAGVLPSESALEPLFLRTYVDLLNYPFKYNTYQTVFLLQWYKHVMISSSITTSCNMIWYDQQ